MSFFGDRTIQRCPVCGCHKPFVALWCSEVPKCPYTKQRNPNGQQQRLYRINEPFRVPG